MQDGRLQRIRYRASQQLIARVAGIHQTTVSRIESGSVAVSEAARARYADAIRRLSGGSESPGHEPGQAPREGAA